VAAVDQAGVVIAVGAGKAVIKAQTKDGGLTAACTVTVPPFGSGRWSMVIILRDYLRGHLRLNSSAQVWFWENHVGQKHEPALDFPEQLISYRVAFPGKPVERKNLRLTTAAGQPLAHQLSNAVEKGGYLREAVVNFRSGLSSGEIKGFILDCTQGQVGNAPSQPADEGVRVEPAGYTRIIAANRQQVRLPFGEIAFDPHPLFPLSKLGEGDGGEGGKPAADVPGPIIAIARDGQTWCGAGSIKAPDAIRVESLRGEVIEQGPLFAKYRVAYAFTGGRKYAAELTVQHNEQHVTIDEYLDGFTPEDDAWLTFSVKEGIDPDGRLVEVNGFYRPSMCKATFDGDLSAGGRLPYELGLYTPNNLGLSHATAFWKEDGDNAIVFSLNRPRDWKTSRRFVWSASGPQNLAFYSTDGRKYMTTRLEGTERHWAVGLISRSEVILKARPGTKAAGKTWLATRDFTGFPGLDDPYYCNYWSYGPEIELFDRLTEHSLNWIKDLPLDWDDGTWMDLPTEPPMTAEDFITQRARRVWNVFTQCSDTRMPHASMMAGHPNFVINNKSMLPVGAARFPTNSQAAYWKNEFVGFFREWLELFVRKADPERNALAGRHTENIACYSLESLQHVLVSARSLRQFDGTDILDHPAVRDWMRWYLYTLMPTDSRIFLVPPQGAHTAGGIPPENVPHKPSRLYRRNLIEVARWIRHSGKDKPLGDTLLYALTRGTRKEEGRKTIDVQSALFNDYGAVLWHDYGGPHEAYVNVQQLSGRGYRWGPANNGMIYYSAKGHRWSWNGDEEAGDQFNIKQLTVFNVNGAGLGEHKVDGPLCNFGGAQFYRALGSNAPYLSRGVMMLRDDYIAIYDDVDGDASGTFQWRGGSPQIYQVKAGPGDNLHVVAPEPLKADAKPWGAIVNGGEYIFMTDKDVMVEDGPARFAGTVGYARDGELALFEGMAISFGGFGISRGSGEFAASAKLTRKNAIEGRIVGRTGGTITITLPPDFGAGKPRVTLEGKNVPCTVGNGRISFDVTISVPDGSKAYTIEAR